MPAIASGYTPWGLVPEKPPQERLFASVPPAPTFRPPSSRAAGNPPTGRAAPVEFDRERPRLDEFDRGRERPRREEFDRERPRREDERSYREERPRRENEPSYREERPRREDERSYREERERPRREEERPYRGERERPRREENERAPRQERERPRRDERQEPADPPHASGKPSRKTSTRRRKATMPPLGTVSALPPVQPNAVPGIEDPSRYEEITPMG